MRSFGVTIVAVIIFFGLFAYIQHFRSEPTGRMPPEPEVESISMFQAEPEDVVAIRVEPDGLVVYRDETGEWQLETDRPYRLDESRIRMFTRLVAPLQAVRVVTEQLQDPGTYGLDDPWLFLTVDLVDGSVVTVEFGDETPLLGARYARVTGEQSVYVVPDYRVIGLGWTIADMRDPTIVPFDMEDVTSFSVYRDDRLEYVFEHAGGEWRMSVPWRMPTDQIEAEDYLRMFRFLRALDYVADEASHEELGDYGLDEPWIRFEATLADGGRAELNLGRVVDEFGDELYFAVTNIEPYLYETMLNRDPVPEVELFLRRRLVPFGHHEIRELELTVGQAAYGPQSRVWPIDGTLFRLETEDRPTSDERELLTNVATLRVDGIAGRKGVPLEPAPGLHPAVAIRIVTDNGTDSRYVLVHSDDRYYLQLDGYAVGLWIDTDQIDRVVSAMKQLQ